MSDEERLVEVLPGWEEQYEAGRDPTAGELRRDCPELAGRAAAEIVRRHSSLRAG